MSYRDIQLANELRDRGEEGCLWILRRPDPSGYHRIVRIDSIERNGEVHLSPEPATHPTTQRRLNRSFAFARSFLDRYTPVTPR